MPKPLRKQSLILARNADGLSNDTRDAAMLLLETVTHLEAAMRLMAQATLLHPTLDESLGIEAQRLIGVCQAVQSEMQTVTRQRCND